MIENIINVDSIQGVLIGITSAAVLGMAGYLWSKFKSNCNNKKNPFDYIWKPEKPILNKDVEKVKNISEHKKTWKMTIGQDGFDVIPESSAMIGGFEAFEQSIIKLLNTEREMYEIYKGSSYGVSYILTDAESDERFNSMAYIVAKEVMKNREEWIKEFHSIKKLKDKNIIVIELGLKGIHEIVKIEAYVIPTKDRT